MITELQPAPTRPGLGWLVLAAAALLSAPAVARAEDNKAECLNAYEQGQRSRKQGGLLSAKQAFLFCSSDGCPEAMHADCQGWLKEVDAAIPKIVFQARSEDGAALTGVTVTIDLGQPRNLDAQPIELDPGEHVFVFSLAGYRELRERVMLPRGDSPVRQVELEQLPVAPSSTPARRATAARRPRLDAPTEAGRSTMWPAWVAAGVGATGAVGFTYFGLTARSEDRALDVCSPACSLERTEAVRRDYLLANVSLGIGAAGLLAAGAWVLFAPEETSAKPRAALDVQLGPVTWVRHRF